MTDLQPKVAVVDSFLQAFASIPRSQQRAVMSFVSKFRENPRSPGINYEVIRNARDKNFRSVRMGRDYRGIVLSPEKGDVYILLWVGKHDDAYDWATRHRCQIHPSTGSLQLFEVDHEIEQRPAEQAAADKEAQSRGDDEPSRQSTGTETATAPLFDLQVETLLSLGVPQEKIALVQALRSEEELESIEPKLPIEAFEALYLLAAGSPLDEILEEYAPKEQEPIDTEDFSEALERPVTQRRFYVPEDEQELSRMLNAPLERWRVFLHPSQRRLVERDWNGPVRVLGGAGTGKTVVAMHRARWLVTNLEWKDGERLLFTTFTSNLALDIEENLRKICTPEQMKRIEVIHLDAWVSQFVRRNNYGSRIVYPSDGSSPFDQCWQIAMALVPAELGLPDSFYKEEFERVILPQQILSRQEYFRADRRGRGVALNRRQRAHIWPVFEEMREQLTRKGYVTAEDAVHYAVGLIQEGEDSRQYKAIIVDETQDFSDQSLHLLRALVPEQTNDMFLVGDAHQRIYQRTTSLKQCGINIIGRGRKLKINYRTTELIRRFATAMLEGIEFDDLDGGVDSTRDYRSLVLGEAPVIKNFETQREEVQWIAEKIHQLVDAGIALQDICIVCRINRSCYSYKHSLEEAGFPTRMLSRKQVDNRAEDGIRVATMHRVKGLEFRAIFMADISAGMVPLEMALESSQDIVEKRLTELNERALFHVAATRAVRYLFISSFGKPSEYLIS